VLEIPHERAPGFDELGIVAFTTTRQAGSFNLGSREPVADVFGRWWRLLGELAPNTSRLASAHQVHGRNVLMHEGSWTGWLRSNAADGHAAFEGATAMAVSLADCVPVFIAHPNGAASILHSGWRGTVARIAVRGVEAFSARGLQPKDLVVHLGPAICGECYVVGPDVFAMLTGRTVDQPTPVDLRAIIARDLSASGVQAISTSQRCTRCRNDLFFSHRAGDEGRQLGVIVSTG
jgi:purine-nucleoside/S-methyl-5'-thioadenosine phosphorylase / adenosine deaminase